MSVLVAFPTKDQVHWRTMYSCMALRCKDDIRWQIAASSVIHSIREQLADIAVKDNFDYIMFIDSDMVFEPDIIDRLMAHDKDIVSAMAFKRKAPFQPCFYSKCRYDIENHDFEIQSPVEWTENELLEIEGVGMACCLIKTKVLKETPKPWFFPFEEFGEDLSFCIRARSQGFKIFLDTSIQVGHLGTFEVNYKHFKNEYDLWQKTNKGLDKTLYIQDMMKGD